MLKTINFFRPTPAKKVETKHGFNVSANAVRAVEVKMFNHISLDVQSGKKTCALSVGCNDGMDIVKLFKAGAETVIGYDVVDYYPDILNTLRENGVDVVCSSSSRKDTIGQASSKKFYFRQVDIVELKKQAQEKLFLDLVPTGLASISTVFCNRVLDLVHPNEIDPFFRALDPFFASEVKIFATAMSNQAEYRSKNLVKDYPIETPLSDRFSELSQLASKKHNLEGTKVALYKMPDAPDFSGCGPEKNELLQHLLQCTSVLDHRTSQPLYSGVSDWGTAHAAVSVKFSRA